MPLQPDGGDWMWAWATAQQQLQGLLAGAAWPATAAGAPVTSAAELARRFAQFGDDYLAITRELWGFVEARCGADDVGSTQRLIQERYLRSFAAAGLAVSPQGTPPSGLPIAGQASYERLVAATLRWQRAAADFNDRLVAAAAEAAGKLIATLAATDASLPAVTSLRQLHDLWVECGEQAYAAAAHRDDFAAAQAELLAAAIEWRFEQRELVEAWARALDLPTRSQVELINERLHRLQRRVVELEGSLARGMEPRE
jgi:hypothetical protein